MSFDESVAQQNFVPLAPVREPARRTRGQDQDSQRARSPERADGPKGGQNQKGKDQPKAKGEGKGKKGKKGKDKGKEKGKKGKRSPTPPRVPWIRDDAANGRS